MGKDQRFGITRNFAKHLIRGGVKSIPLVGNLFDEIIFGTLDGESAQEESKKLHDKLDEISKKIDTQEGDFAEILAGLHLQSDFNEEVRKEFAKIEQLLRDPENAPVPESFNLAFEKLIEQNEELKQEFEKVQESVGGLADDHDWQDEKLISIEDKVTAIFDKMLDDAESGGGLRRKRALEVWFSEQWPETDANVFGRDEQLEVLNEAWEQDKLRVASLVAAGGVGKTAIVNRWKNFHMVPNSWCGAERVFGWSFYSQGSGEGRQVSGDKFIQKALEWFGDEDPTKGSPWDKGVRLADLVKSTRTLLFLDGLEPLQEPPGSKTGQEGKIKDPTVAALIKNLAMGNSGLCVISTRVRIWDMKSYEKGPVLQKDLDNLTKEMGAAYLRSMDVHGLEDELQDASEEYGNHALALTLLGNFLRIHKDGDICCRGEITDLFGTREYGKHAERVMAFYEKWFEGQAELDLLYVLGLFDRPVERGAIDAVCGDTMIEGLTEVLGGLTTGQWEDMLDVLRNARLISRDSSRDKFDCHPLIREHFGAKLKEENPAAWREAHGRLYEYYRDLPEKELPDTLEEMEPLFSAVAHGCAAGRHQETFDDVYWKRIQRGGEVNYCFKRLGAVGADLAALAGFFERCWEKPTEGLSDSDKGLVLNSAGFALQAVGRLSEAVDLMKAAIENGIRRKAWESAAISGGNISKLYLTLGDVDKAVEYARRSVEYADRSGNERQRLGKRAYFGEAMHACGDLKSAEMAFCEAEKMIRKLGYSYLFAVWGYNFCDLLLDLKKYKDVIERAEGTINSARKSGGIFDVAIEYLSLGKAYMMEAIEEKRRDFEKAREYLDGAVEGLREAGAQEFIARGLIERAELYRHTGEYGKAWGDLEEAREIAERGQMRLYLADCALEAARIYNAQEEKEKAKEELAIGKKLVEETGYGRRDKEVQELLAVLSDDYIVG